MWWQFIAQTNKPSFPSLARRSEKRSPSPLGLDITLKDYTGRCVLKETKKTTTTKMVTVIQYMEENQLSDIEFRHHLFNGQIQLFAWVSSLPLRHCWPIARYQIKNLEVAPFNKTGFVDLFLSGSGYPYRPMAHGLVGLSERISLSALDSGSVQPLQASAKQDIFITKHTVFMEGKPELKIESIVNPKGWLPHDITSRPLLRRAGRLASYRSDLFEDNSLKIVVADIIPDFDFRAWSKDDAYRESNFELVKSTFETVIDEHKFIPKSLLDRRAYILESFEVGKLLSEVTSLPDGDYRIARDVKGFNFEPNQCRLEIKIPSPVISRSQLIVFDFNEDMYSLGGEAEDIVLHDELVPEELDNELDYQSDLNTKDKRLLVLKGWLGASMIDVLKPLKMTRQQLWDKLSETDSRIFPPTSESTIKDFFRSQDLCYFKLGRRRGK
jgi:hypothetical protein